MLLAVSGYRELLYDPRFQNETILRDEPSRVTVNLTDPKPACNMFSGRGEMNFLKRAEDLNMSSEVTYAEVRFKNESKSSGSQSEPPEAPKENTSFRKCNSGFLKLPLVLLLTFLLLFGISFSVAFTIYYHKYSHCLKEEKTIKEIRYTTLECVKENLKMEGPSFKTEQVWSCCPKSWISFRSHCYFVSANNRNWSESEKRCSEMNAHLLVITTKEEEDFITQKLPVKNVYYIGLSDPKGKRQWQWVDQAPYNKSITFWHPGEPSNPSERCVILNYASKQWGWNDVYCHGAQTSVCKMTKIYI
ncbi:C-type lectin domain family 4 member A isoform X1 [Equus caballus]|uniref:C-type lectin domain family 4 member A isoform X1 n=2 Tax=Equus caballus TaxID=9796 RepID=UPI000FC4B7EE